jgi:hypothetical protein
MKIILTQADFRIAIAAYLATQGMNPDSPAFDSMEIDLDNIEIDLNPDFPKETKDKPVQPRKRRTKAEIEAEELKARVNPVYGDTEVVTETKQAKEADSVFASASTTEDSLDDTEETLGSIVDTLVEASSKPKREEPDSLFG